MAWISNHKHKIEEKSTKIFRSSSKVVGFGPADLWEFPTLILAQTHHKLLCGQDTFPRILSQIGQNDLEGHVQWPSFSIPTESIPWCMFGANLVISAQNCNVLSCRQSKVYRQTDGLTDRWTQAMTISLWPERPRGKKSMNLVHNSWNALSYNHDDVTACQKCFPNYCLSSYLYNRNHSAWKDIIYIEMGALSL